MQPEATKTPDPAPKWFDKFTKVALATMFIFLAFIFVSGKYMDSHKMEAGGTDDAVNDMAAKVASGEHHPFVELPGDAEVGAFSIANFFAGLIVGHHWNKLFGKDAVGRKEEEETGEEKLA